MDFSFTEEQNLLRNSVQKFVQNDYGFEPRRAIIKSETGWKRDNWMKFAELGLLGARHSPRTKVVWAAARSTP